MIRHHASSFPFLFSCLLVASSTSFGAAQDTAPGGDSVKGLVRSLGYGGAIHQFKNFVLRGDAKYETAAKARFSEAAAHLKKLSAADLSESESQAVAAIDAAVRKYTANIAMVAEMHRAKKSVEEIDERVAVDDKAAIAALLMLRKRQAWPPMDELEFHLGYGSGIHNYKNFVLRADEKYRARALLGLSRVVLIVARLKESDKLTKEQQSALDAIAATVTKYQSSLPTVNNLVREGKTAAQIDAVVKVDDSAALKAITMLGN